MLKRARIRGYKSLIDAEITFTDPLTLIIGPNASGKSNLFDALALLSRLVTSQKLQDAFEDHRGSPFEAFSLGEKGVAGLLEEPTVSMSFEVDVELSPEIIERVEDAVFLQDPNAQTDFSTDPQNHPKYIEWRLFRYSLEIEMSTKEGRLRVKNEELSGVSSFAVNGKGKKLISTVKDSGNVPTTLIRSKTAKTTRASFGNGPHSTSVAFPLNPIDHSDIIAFRAELASWRFYNLEPHLMKGWPLGEHLVLGANGANFSAYFHTLKVQNPLKFRQMIREMHMIVPQIQSFDTEITGFDLDVIVHENNIPYSSRIISEGTLRVLGILALTNPQEPTSLIGLEEPENGVHPHRLALIANHLQNSARRRGKSTQMLLTTHSPLFAEFFSPDQIVVCQREDQQTAFIPMRQAGIFPLHDALPNGEAEDPITPTSVSERIIRGDYGG